MYSSGGLIHSNPPEPTPAQTWRSNGLVGWWGRDHSLERVVRGIVTGWQGRSSTHRVEITSADSHWPVALGPSGPIPSLTGLRTIAALAVLLFHYSQLVDLPPVIELFARDGHAGVGLFFVLSGFVLAYNYAGWFAGDLVRFRSFLWARFARIAPMHLLALLLMTPVGLATLRLAPHWREYGLRELILSWLSNLVLLHGLIPLQITRVWNVPSWSISDELLFYLAFPLFTYYVLDRQTRGRSLAVLAALLYGLEAVALLGATFSVYVVSRGMTSGDAAYLLDMVAGTSPFVRIWEFLIGCVAGVLYVTPSSSKLDDLLKRAMAIASVRNWTLAAVLAAVAGLVLFARSSGLAGIALDWLRYFLLFTPYFAILILALAAGPTFLTPLLSNRLMVRLGDASYSLYIIHWIPFVVLKQMMIDGHRPAAWLSLLSAVATIGVSVLLFDYIETPARRWLRERAPRWAKGIR